MAKSGYLARLRVSGAPVAFADQTTETTDNQTYRIIDPIRRVLDRDLPVTVEVGGVVTGETYELNRLNGEVTFATADAGRAAVTITGSFLPMADAGEAREYSYSIEASNEDATVFGDRWRRRQQAGKDASGSLSRFHVDDAFTNVLYDGTPIVIEFSLDVNLEPDLRMWAILSSEEISGSVDGLVEGSIDFEATSDIDNKAIAVI
jgi:hypothetical protein